MLGVFFAYTIAFGILVLVLWGEPTAFEGHMIFPTAFIISLFISALLVRQIVTEYHRRLASGMGDSLSSHHGRVEEWICRLLLNFETDFRSILPSEGFQTAKFRWKDLLYQFYGFFVIASLIAGFLSAHSVDYYDIPVHPLLAFVVPVFVTALLIFLIKRTFFEGYGLEMQTLNAMRDQSFLEWCHSNGYSPDPVDTLKVLFSYERYVDYVNGESEAFVKWLRNRKMGDVDEGDMFRLYDEFEKERKE